MTHFIECDREGGGKVRIHIDAFDAIWEGETGKGENKRQTLTVLLRNHHTLALANETMDTLWNKIEQCPQGKRHVIRDPAG